MKFRNFIPMVQVFASFALASLATPDLLAQGASMPFKSVEAESGTLGGGAVIRSLALPPPNSQSSPELEASGHAFVQLNATGQSVTLANNTGQNITALNVRYSIPDSAGGGGITATLAVYVNGTFRQTITLNSKQTWCYQTSGSEHGWNQTPSYGQPHIFYDETHFFLNAPAVAPGSTIMFRKDSGNSASFYWLDVVDMENPPGPLSQPANSLSIVSYGAVANDPARDSTAAIRNCISAAQSQGKSVWVPQGTFYLNDPSGSMGVATGITIEGAGMWYSTLYSNPTLPASPSNILEPHSCVVRNLTFDSNAIGGGSGQGNGGGLNVKGNNWVVDSCWIQHLGAGVWANGITGIVRNTRTGCTWADGINLNNGNGAPNNNAGNFLTASNCFVRGSGDDGLALNSGNSPGCIQMTNTTVINCTSVAPWWANNLGIYGGVNIVVSNNLCTDSCGAYGISAGVFGNTGLPLQSGTVMNNTLYRCGSYGFYNQNGVPAMNIGTTHSISNVTVGGNNIYDAVFMGMGFEFCGANVVIQNNLVSNPRTTGYLVASDATGGATIRYNTAQNIRSGQSAYLNLAPSFNAVLSGNSWQSTKKLLAGTTVSLKAMANNKFVTAPNGGASSLIASATAVGTAEQFAVVDAGNGNIGFRALANNQYVCAESAGANPLIANRAGVGPWETFTELDAGGGNIALRALANSQIVCAESAGANPLIANRTAIGSWETFTVSVVSGAGVIFYQDTNYGGAVGQSLAKGTYTTSQLAAKGVLNDWASSVKIPAGWTVIIYANDNFGGTSWTRTADTPDFTVLSPNANDQMSSCKVQ